jgi:hypothetical protein
MTVSSTHPDFVGLDIDVIDFSPLWPLVRL